MLRIRKPRNFSFFQAALVCTLGVLGGAYIYQPILLKHLHDNKNKESEAKQNLKGR